MEAGNPTSVPPMAAGNPTSSPPMAANNPISVPPMAAGNPTAAPPVSMPGLQPQAPSQWSTGLCDCFDDCGNCSLTFICPCITFGQIAEIVDRGSTPCITGGAMYALIAMVAGCPCLYSSVYRSKLRALYALPETPCNDCLVHCCCEPCALCQAYRELQNRGFIMALGWQGNMDRMQGVGMVQPPPVQGGMMR